MSDALLVRLSMLLDGALPEDEAAHLRARIASEPEVAEAWAVLLGLPPALGGLPDAVPPPPALDAAVLAAVTTAPRRRRRRWWPAAAVAAAGIGLWLSWPVAEPVTLTLVAGQQTVEGEVTVLAAHVPVAVSGRADIFVEPQSGWTREPQQEDEGMVRMISAMGAGVLVTVAVYEGAAVVSPPGEAPVTVAAGEQHSVSMEAERPALLQERQARRPAAEGGEAVSEELSAYIDDLEAEVAALRLERDMQQGALRAMEGEQQPWPPDIAPQYEPEAFSASMSAFAEAHPDLDLLGVDCDEYPCLAMFESHSESEDWGREIGEQLEGEWGTEAEGANVSMWASINESESGRVQLLGVSVLGPSAGGDEALHHRSEWRMEGWMEAATEEAMAGDE